MSERDAVAFRGASAGNLPAMTATPEQSWQPRQEDALETGAAQQDAEGRRTRDPVEAVEHAESEAERNTEHLERGEVGPGVPED
jgi:hypothetical protein